ncbi:hypothetical protein K9F62_03035 [Desulfovibrio sp. JY]|nr:hypothetical protein K9F62_03035 [Desulfovibrio sp. JY]
MDEQQRKPPEQINWRLLGDRERADSLRGVGLQFKAQAAQQNVYDYPVFVRRFAGSDGTTYSVLRNCGPLVDVWTIEIFCPPRTQPLQPEREPVDIPALQAGQFYYVPGCKARYSFKDEDLQNEIYIAQGSVDPNIDGTNKGYGVKTLSFKDVGLASLLPSPDGSISRNAKVCYLEGAEPNSGFSGGRLQMSSYNLPTSGAFSVSALVRLRKPIELDYSFTSKTQELDCGYQVYNPIKPRILTSDDGTTWSAVCPGSAVPLIGWHIPSRFSKHWVKFTYPWPTYNENFVASAEHLIGYREIGTICDGEPLLASDYDSASPYWDKVAGELETLTGEFQNGWEENAEVANAAPYASFCTFKVDGEHGKAAGTRAVASLSDGSKRYSTVISYVYEYNGDGSVKDTILTLKDYQYKLYMTDAQPSLAFGNQPFPVCHSQGYMIGTNFCGLLWYNGNRILAGKICNYESEYSLLPIVSDELDIAAWYHVCLAMDASGNCSLYITKQGDNNTLIFKSMQSLGNFVPEDGFGEILKLPVAADDWSFTRSPNDPVSKYTSQWEFSSYMDITMMRFYHHMLTKEEAVLLAKEAFGQAFVADDSEAGQLQGMGMQAMMV